MSFSLQNYIRHNFLLASYVLHILRSEQVGKELKEFGRDMSDLLPN